MSFRYLLIFILFISCGVKQPVDINLEDDTGSVWVTSDPSGASIFLDGVFANKSTPDTLYHISTGNHIISVLKEGYKADVDSVAIAVEKDSLKRVMFHLEEIVHLGSVYFESTPSGAEIFVDDQSTAKFTPDTVRIEPGRHFISARKNGFNVFEREYTIVEDSLISSHTDLEIAQCVLFESFGNVSCLPCTTSAGNLERFRSEHTDKTYALLEYYANWPAVNDPFYLVSPDDIDQRVQSVYRIVALPSLKINGVNDVDATEYNKITSAYEQVIANQHTQLALSISKQKESTELQVEIELFDYNSLLNNTNLRLFVAVVEDDIHLSEPPGLNGLKDFNFVFRRFLSSRLGDEITGTVMKYTFQWPEWDYSQAQIMAFVQDINTNEVVQSSIR